MFNEIGQVTEALRQQQYISTDEISTVMFLADKLEKPLLTEGPAGVGKTELAKAWSKATGKRLIRLQCYEGLDESKALYEWEYAKQMLYTQLLRDKLSDLLAEASSLSDAADRLAQEEDVFFSDRFLLARPLLQAITADEPVVLLIDEIDRADEEFEAFLLELLSDFQVTIPELGTIRAAQPPVVIVTSNRTREVHDALKRRCLYYWIEYPDFQKELAIVRAKAPDVEPMLAKQITAFVQELRRMELFKAPGIAETLDWTSAVIALDQRALSPEVIADTLGVILKYEDDIKTFRPEVLGAVYDRARLQAEIAHG